MPIVLASVASKRKLASTFNISLSLPRYTFQLARTFHIFGLKVTNGGSLQHVVLKGNVKLRPLTFWDNLRRSRYRTDFGEVPEWFKGLAWKVSVR